MSTVQDQPELYGSSPAKAMKLSTIADMETPPPSRRGSRDVLSEEGSFGHWKAQQQAPQTPPESTSGSPHINPTESVAQSEFAHPFPVRLDQPYAPLNSPVRLPSLDEFDQGVEALARSYGPQSPWTAPATTLPSISQAAFGQKSLPQLQPYSPPDPAYSFHGYSGAEHLMHAASPQMGYPSPPPDCDQRHCNKKYTTEEGDFIIYAWHDKKKKWQTIQKEFAHIFGTKPERSVQGLQAWYYRMNQRIPVWDQDGWLVFNDEDEVEPRYVTIKCREREAVLKNEPLGLAQRYPERAIHYHWVDPEVKRQARDWAAKRVKQYEERRERRKRKEQRRARL